MIVILLIVLTLFQKVELIFYSFPAPKPQTFFSIRSKSYTLDTIRYTRAFGIMNCKNAYCIEPTPDKKKEKKDKLNTALNPEKSEGITITCKDKQYVIYNKKIRYADIWTECCSHSMIPASIDSIEQINCLKTEYIKQFPQLQLNENGFFTAHVDVTSLRNFASCTTGNTIAKDLWRPSEPNNADNEEACVDLVLHAIKSGFRDVKCTANQLKQPICEVPNNKSFYADPFNASQASIYYSPETVPYFIQNNVLPDCKTAFCKKEPSKIENPEPLLEGCGKIMYIPEKEVLAINIWQECCKYGMLPARLHSLVAMECFAQKFGTKVLGDQSEILIYMGHRDANLDRKFISVSSSWELDPELWMYGQPDNAGKDEACSPVYMDATTIRYVDTSCNRTFKIMCELVKDWNWKSEISNEVKDPPIKSAISSTYYDSLTVSYMRSSGITACISAFCNNKVSAEQEEKKPVDESAGISISTCKNKSYLLTKKKVKYADIWKVCCSYGMIPASVDSAEDLKCIAESYVKQHGNTDDDNSTYFTAYVDEYLKNVFTSCATSKILPSNLWGKYQPNNLNDTEACTVLRLQPFNLGYFDVTCLPTYKTAVICEMSPLSLEPKEFTVERCKKTSVVSMYKNEVYSHLSKTMYPNCRSAFTDIEEFKFSGTGPTPVLSVCNRHLMLTEEKYMVNEIWQQCAKYGMIPASFNSFAELECFHNEVVREEDDLVGGSFITGVRDANLNSVFMSCVTGRVIPTKYWSSGSPDNSGGSEACAAYYMTASETRLKDMNCNIKHRILCEISERLLKKSPDTSTDKKKQSNCLVNSNVKVATQAVKTTAKVTTATTKKLQPTLRPVVTIKTVKPGK